MNIIGPITDFAAQVGSDNVLNSDKFLDLAQVIGLPYVKRDFLFRSGIWRGSKQTPVFRNSLDTELLLIGHSDKATSALHQKLIRQFGVKQVLGTNLQEVEGFSTALPLGLTNNTNESELHRIFGNLSHFTNAWDSPGQLVSRGLSVLVGFTENTNPIRKKLLKILLNEKVPFSVTYHDVTFSDHGRIDFLSKSRSHDMVLCPEGNGFDTHRFWETLYMGGVPVVVKNPYLNPLYRLYPCVVLNSWNDLSDNDLIGNSLINAREKVWDPLALTFDFWKMKIEAKRLETSEMA